MQHNAKQPSQGALVRVLLVDDHPVYRRGLKSLLETRPDLVVCAQAEDAARGSCNARWTRLSENSAAIDGLRKRR